MRPQKLSHEQADEQKNEARHKKQGQVAGHHCGGRHGEPRGHDCWRLRSKVSILDPERGFASGVSRRGHAAPLSRGGKLEFSPFELLDGGSEIVGDWHRLTQRIVEGDHDRFGFGDDRPLGTTGHGVVHGHAAAAQASDFRADFDRIWKLHLPLEVALHRGKDRPRAAAAPVGHAQPVQILDAGRFEPAEKNDIVDVRS